MHQTCRFLHEKVRGEDRFYAEIRSSGYRVEELGPFPLLAQARVAAIAHSERTHVQLFDDATGKLLRPPCLTVEQIDQLRVCGRALAEFLAKGVPGSHHPLHHVKEALRLLRTLGVAA